MSKLWELLCIRFHDELEKTRQPLKLSVVVEDAFSFDSYLEVRGRQGEYTLYFSTMGTRMILKHLHKKVVHPPERKLTLQEAINKLDVGLLLRSERLPEKEWAFLEEALRQVMGEGESRSFGRDGCWITIAYYPEEEALRRWRYWTYPPQEWRQLGTVTSLLGRKLSEKDGERLRTKQGDRIVEEWKQAEAARQEAEWEKNLQELEEFIRAAGNNRSQA